ncbi:MAG: HAMP domain-containing protein, partial [Burkholderiales bacterium]
MLAPAIRAKYFRVIAAATLFLFVLSMATVVYSSYRSVLEAGYRLQAAEAAHAAQQIADRLAASMALAQEVASQPWDQLDGSLAQKTAELQRLLKLVPPMIEVRLDDGLRGCMLLVSRTAANRMTCENVLVPDLTSPSAKPVSGEDGQPPPLLAYSAVRRDGNGWMVVDVQASSGQQNFTIIATLSLQFVSEMMRNIRIGESDGSGGVAFIIDANGMLLAHPDPAVQLASWEAAAGNVGRPINPYPLVQGQSGPHFYSTAELTNPPWRVVVQQERDDVLRPFYSALWGMLAFFILGCAVILAGSRYLASRFAAPIRSLSAAANAIASGNLDQRVDLQSRDELGQLAGTFNKMAAELQEYTKGLEKKVAEKTAQL